MTELPPCRSCGANDLELFLSLGDTPLADALVKPEDVDRPEGQYPLEVAFCPACSLVQITEEVPADVLFVDNYLYFSSFSDALLQHSRDHALGLVKSRELGSDSLVVELASNDGYLLRNFVEEGIPVLGVDPAPDQARAANEAGVPTVAEFFGPELAERIRSQHGPADIIIANNVMAHVPDLNGFVGGMAKLLADDGIITVENPYVRDLIEHCEFDTIYHEHFCYYSCSSVDALVRRHSMFLNHVEYFPDMHGGTLRWHIGKTEDVSPTAREYLDREAREGLTAFDAYARFGDRVQAIRSGLLELLRDLKADGASIAAYGAAAKGSTLVNYVGIDTQLIDFVVDRNVHKQGLLMPGVHIPIEDPEALVRKKPDYVLLLAWNFRNEIAAQQAEYLDNGGRFIVPIPSPEIL
ncbi:MAG: class I SAM-dependent methyltransferase [Actinomycetia bacterium]|nr:class I SAM-dependent methyltransferase [Actinomycetes bacterium]